MNIKHHNFLWSVLFFSLCFFYSNIFYFYLDGWVPCKSYLNPLPNTKSSNKVTRYFFENKFYKFTKKNQLYFVYTLTTAFFRRFLKIGCILPIPCLSFARYMFILNLLIVKKIVKLNLQYVDIRITFNIILNSM